MTTRYLLLLPAAALFAAAPAFANEGKKSGQPDPEFGERAGPPSLFKTSVGGDLTSFNHGKGSRRTLGGELIRDFGDTSLVFGITQGRRNFGKGKKIIEGARFAASLSHDWGGPLSTTTSIAAGTGGPVFERFRIAQDVDLKLGGGTVVRIGGRFASYQGGMEVRTGSAGITQYFGGGFLSYRLSAFDIRGRGTSVAHLASLQIKDPIGKGTTQLWAGTGSSLHDLDWMPDTQKGRLSSLTLKRSQPLTKQVAVSLSAGRSWYDRPLGAYQGNKFGLGFSFRR